jgi:transcriptional regulator
MYLPPHFDESTDREGALALMRARPFGQLVSVDGDGFPFSTHLPLHVQASPLQGQGDAASGIKLLGHVARPNLHWRLLQANPKALVVFRGPSAYLSPSVYPDLARVPTWNYTVLQAKVEATLLNHADTVAKDKLLKCLIGDHEPAYAQQWIDLGQDYQHKMLQGIVAFELTVVSWQFKVKVNQHRTEAHAKMLEQYQAGSADEQALAQSLLRVLQRKLERASP